jgi:flagellar basal body rod protein FlgF
MNNFERRAFATLMSCMALTSCQADNAKKIMKQSGSSVSDILVPNGVERLQQAPRIESERIGEEGSYSSLIKSLKQVVAGKQAKVDLMVLIQSKSPTAVAYGLIGMFYLDKTSYLEAKKQANLDEQVKVLFGDLEGTVALSELLTVLEQNRVNFGLKQTSQ